MTSILIIYTGGTIGMVEAEDGQTLVPFNFEKLMEQVPELKKVDAKLAAQSFDKPIDSSDMCPNDWVRIAKVIQSHYDTMDGFVILHGSDTLAYTASALSFMLDGLRKPVILTGSQLPIGMIRTDARENFLTAVQIAAEQKQGAPVIQEVAVYFEYKLYRGNRTTKISAEAFEAFESPNYAHLIEAGVHLGIRHHRLFRSEKETLTLFEKLDENIAVLTVYPGITRRVVDAILNVPELKGVVLQTFGSGNAPQAAWFIDALRDAIDRGIVIVNISQCIRGSVEQGRYETSKRLKEIGVVGGGDMTLEATLTKLMHLFGRGLTCNAVRSQINTDIRGEIST